jgi:hypothetical protein
MAINACGVGSVQISHVYLHRKPIGGHVRSVQLSCLCNHVASLLVKFTLVPHHIIKTYKLGYSFITMVVHIFKVVWNVNKLAWGNITAHINVEYD